MQRKLALDAKSKKVPEKKSKYYEPVRIVQSALDKLAVV